MSEQSAKPYLVRAICEWCADNGLTPYLAVRVNRETKVPAAYVKNGDRFFFFAETGNLVIGKLSPKGYVEIDKAKILEQTNNAFGRKVVWSHPAFAARCAFVRNDKEIVCVSLAAE